MKIVISSGHALKVRGASGVIDEVDEARKVVERVADELRSVKVDVVVFHDDVSTSQSENLERIVDFHNAQGDHDCDVSVHFNAYEHTEQPMGTECLWVTQSDLAGKLAEEMSIEGELINRGPKNRTDLYFLNNMNEPAVLLEVCFVDSTTDAELYEKNFDRICHGIAGVLSGEEEGQKPPRVKPSPKPKPMPPRHDLKKPLLYVRGKVSYFGGPEDMGVDADEGLAFLYEYEDAPYLFLPEQPPGTTGLARRLNVQRNYVAVRWDYDRTPKEMLRQMYPALVRAPATNRYLLAWPADWGPHEDTGRVADISPELMQRLGIETDGEIEVAYPAPIYRDFKA